MLVLLVRHGHAGTKRHRRGDDTVRALNGQGLAESAALAHLLIPFAPGRIISSPFRRCLETMHPLSEALGLPVERSQCLVPDAGARAKKFLLRVSAEGSGPVAVCTHGEVIHEVQAHLGEDGPESFGPGSLREKASVWVLDRRGGRFVSATYLPPPASGGRENAGGESGERPAKTRRSR
jgi:8-oxo-dGTP diphosphatase